jgi:hypothetical protein
MKFGEIVSQSEEQGHWLCGTDDEYASLLRRVKMLPDQKAMVIDSEFYEGTTRENARRAFRVTAEELEGAVRSIIREFSFSLWSHARRWFSLEASDGTSSTGVLCESRRNDLRTALLSEANRGMADEVEEVVALIRAGTLLKHRDLFIVAEYCKRHIRFYPRLREVVRKLVELDPDYSDCGVEPHQYLDDILLDRVVFDFLMFWTSRDKIAEDEELRTVSILEQRFAEMQAEVGIRGAYVCGKPMGGFLYDFAERFFRHRLPSAALGESGLHQAECLYPDREESVRDGEERYEDPEADYRASVNDRLDMSSLFDLFVKHPEMVSRPRRMAIAYSMIVGDYYDREDKAEWIDAMERSLKQGGLIGKQSTIYAEIGEIERILSETWHKLNDAGPAADINPSIARGIAKHCFEHQVFSASAEKLRENASRIKEPRQTQLTRKRQSSRKKGMKG